jgi:phosphoglycolate phosphatase
LQNEEKMNYLLWDIDGTLMLTNFAGVAAMKQTVETLYGVPEFTFTYGMSGRTDKYITRRAVEQLTGSCSQKDIDRFIKVYAGLLPASMTAKHGHLLPHVKECLAWADASPDCKSVLLTGNCEPAAHAKVAHFGIEKYFDFKLSAFGELSEQRSDLSRLLWQKIQKADTKASLEDLLIIGDTPHDAECAAAIGARCLLVKNGSVYKEADLIASHPWKMIEELPSSPEDCQALFVR